MSDGFVMDGLRRVLDSGFEATSGGLAEPGLVALAMACGFGLLLGMRHAFEPDHLAAVATLVARPGPRRGAAVLGAFWGLGHTVALVVAGGTLLLLRTQMPAWMNGTFELLVSVMLVLLGVLTVRRGFRPHTHEAGSTAHSHTHAEALWPLGARPLAIGLLHGLAGSGALTVLVVARMPTLGSAILYMALFGLGSALGMAVLTGLLGRSIHHLGARQGEGGRAHGMLTAGAGILSLGVGLFWAFESASSLFYG